MRLIMAVDKKEKKKKRFKRRRILLLIVLISFVFATIDISRSLSTFKKVDDYPLYTMHYRGGYRTTGFIWRQCFDWFFCDTDDSTSLNPQTAWACSLFSALGDRENMTYGRNFDWSFSPVLLLFTDPPNGYASILLVNLAYLGFDKDNPSLFRKLRLLATPVMPFEGINEHGLVVAMAAVPDGSDNVITDKKNIQSLHVIRLILDHARTTEQAIDILKNYNVVFSPGPPLHYLIADVSGRSIVAEFREGGLQVISNTHTWQVATNFLLLDRDQNEPSGCIRYDNAQKFLREKNGIVNTHQAMSLLKNLSVDVTQWSAVYNMGRRSVDVVLKRNYGKIYNFQIPCDK